MRNVEVLRQITLQNDKILSVKSDKCQFIRNNPLSVLTCEFNNYEVRHIAILN